MFVIVQLNVQISLFVIQKVLWIIFNEVTSGIKNAVNVNPILVITEKSFLDLLFHIQLAFLLHKCQNEKHIYLIIKIMHEN